ncbi:acetoacetate decarboxylase family protein [Bacillus sp. UNC438CL73TsuS30]|uniref:acetoacetate decarboxylase family protein n=1 Tax=Bacillus sp. UNC438CL73TsuS30 TaxID=1340434 RepID=UPI000478A66E|nr:acetoacetate decarboxylase family protein [Bacillus sp. UNC438CL73TsuS30]
MSKYEYTILPEYSPLYPALPYHYEDYQKVSVYCQGDIEALQRFLPKEFKVTSDVFEVFVLTNIKIQGLDLYSEGGIVIPCSFKDIEGACVAFEYVDTDGALCAGREIWGYPKKLAEVQFKKDETSIRGVITRKGKKIIDVTFEKDQGSFYEPPILSPRLQVKRMPNPEVYGTDTNFVIKNVLQNAETKKKVYGQATINIEPSAEDPLSELGIKKVLGAMYMEGAFTLTYGEIVENLNK